MNNSYADFVHLSRYARWREELGRRETWPETVQRYTDFWIKRFPSLEGPIKEAYTAIVNKEIMPSMRALMTAGPALERDEMAGFNCAYVEMSHQRAFDEIMYVLMCGTGMGFSVERQFIADLPTVADDFFPSDTVIVVPDSKIGWATSLREIISLLYSGRIPKWDLSKIRPAGARLKTFGGRASGPEPLDELFRFLISTFQGAKGRRLNSLEVHDIVCKIADVVVVGGVRRSALLSLSNLTDERMRNAKSGQWWENNVQRALANNSVAYTETPDVGIFLKEWHSLYESKSGERGIFNRVAATKQSARTGRRVTEGHSFGTNPCGEVILRSSGLCNLTEVVIRPEDTLTTLERKVRLATFLGTLQSTLTNFRYVRPIWKKNAEEERLLGVSLTGIMDHPTLGKPSRDCKIWLERMRGVAVDENALWAERIGINPSAAITTVKPSGTVSQLVDSSSGIHPRFSKFYLRTVRCDKKDPLAVFMRGVGFPVEDDVTKPGMTDVFSFPIKSPSESIFRNDVSAIEQLELYLVYKTHWCEHNASITVYMREQEWMDVGAWVLRHFDQLGGVSFLPHTEHIYRQAPYTEITEEAYEEWMSKMPRDISWEDFRENHDETTASQEYACLSGVCDII